MNTLALAWRNIGRNRRRSALSAIAIAVAALSIVFLFSLLEGMKRDLSANLINFYTGEVRVRHADYERYEHLSPLHLAVDEVAATLAALDAEAGVEAAVPRLSVPGAVFDEDRRIAVEAIGVDFAREAEYSRIGDYIVAGTFARVASFNPDANVDGPRVVPVVAGRSLPDRLGIELGDRFTVVARTARRGTNALTFEVAAIADFPVAALDELAFWAPLERVQRLAWLEGQAGEILVRMEPGITPETAEERVAAAVSAVRGEGAVALEVQHWTMMQTSYAMIELADAVYNFIALVFFLLASTVIVNTTMMVIHERRREIGTLTALGMRPGYLVRLFFVESLLIGIIGAGAGTLAGIGLTEILGITGLDFGGSLEQIDFEISTVIYPVLNLRSTIGVFLFATIVSAVTSYIPTRRVARIEPVVALRTE